MKKQFLFSCLMALIIPAICVFSGCGDNTIEKLTVLYNGAETESITREYGSTENLGMENFKLVAHYTDNSQKEVESQRTTVRFKQARADVFEDVTSERYTEKVNAKTLDVGTWQIGFRCESGKTGETENKYVYGYFNIIVQKISSVSDYKLTIKSIIDNQEYADNTLPYGIKNVGFTYEVKSQQNEIDEEEIGDLMYLNALGNYEEGKTPSDYEDSYFTKLEAENFVPGEYYVFANIKETAHRIGFKTGFTKLLIQKSKVEVDNTNMEINYTYSAGVDASITPVMAFPNMVSPGVYLIPNNTEYKLSSPYNSAEAKIGALTFEDLKASLTGGTVIYKSNGLSEDNQDDDAYKFTFEQVITNFKEFDGKFVEVVDGKQNATFNEGLNQTITLKFVPNNLDHYQESDPFTVVVNINKGKVTIPTATVSGTSFAFNNEVFATYIQNGILQIGENSSGVTQNDGSNSFTIRDNTNFVLYLKLNSNFEFEEDPNSVCEGCYFTLHKDENMVEYRLGTKTLAEGE